MILSYLKIYPNKLRKIKLYKSYLMNSAAKMTRIETKMRPGRLFFLGIGAFRLELSFESEI